jgi:hypothetical protein
MSVDGAGNVTQEKMYDLMGMDPAEFTDIENDPMPANGSGDSDPRVVDQDEDGNPGMTIQAKSTLAPDTDLFVAQRNWGSMEGTFTDASGERISGLVQFGMEQTMLGAQPADSLLASVNPKNQQAPDASKSYFKMVQVDPGTTCADIISEQDTLFDF